MLYTLLQHGVETTVDRRHKTHRIINWIKQVKTIELQLIKMVLAVYTHSMTTIYPFLRAQVAKSTFFMKSPVSYLLA